MRAREQELALRRDEIRPVLRHALDTAFLRRILFVVEFPVARVVSYKIDGKDKTEAEITIDLKAFLSLADAVTNTSLCPYRLYNVAA